MKDNLKFILLDGRGKDITFKTEILNAISKLKPGEGIHIIKEFEPLPLYALMENHGFIKTVDKKSDNEYHAWFINKSELFEPGAIDSMNLNNEDINKILDIKLKAIRSESSPGEAWDMINRTFDSIDSDDSKISEYENKGEHNSVKFNKYNISPNVVIAALLKEYPFLKEFFITLNPKFKLLNNPVVFKTMGNIATLKMIAKRGGFEVSDLIEKIVGEIDSYLT